jgi:rhodanese-related sulfurtransferase
MFPKSRFEMSKELHDVDPNTLREWLEQGRASLIDVREPYEYNLERIEGATLLPLSTFSPDQLPQSAKGPFVFYCKAGVRSATAAKKYMDSGPNEAYHLEGGIDFWIHSKMPTKKKQSAVISIERQFQVVLGVTISLLALLTSFVHSAFIWPLLVLGALLLFAGSTGICGLTIFLSKLPYNQR